MTYISSEERKKRADIRPRIGFKPTHAEHNGLAVHRLNHSATLSACLSQDVFLHKACHVSVHKLIRIVGLSNYVVLSFSLSVHLLTALAASTYVYTVM